MAEITILDSVADVIEWILAGLVAGLVIRVSAVTNDLRIIGLVLIVAIVIGGSLNYLMKSQDLGT